MKKFYFAVVLCLLTTLSVSAQLLVGTYNIRYKNSGDSVKGDVWNKRCQVICDQVNFMAPDIFGTQEVLHGQLLDMLAQLDGYDCIGVGRDDGMTAGEYAAIFYNTRRLRLLDEGHFWLNETPDRPALGWDAACIRICSWGKFAAQTATNDEAFFVFNLHMDHVGVTARREAAKLVLDKIRQMAAGAPVVLTGDFNADQDDEVYGIFTGSGLLKDSYAAANRRFAENGTFNSFKSELYTTSRIDHIMVSPSVDVEAYGVLTDGYWTADEESDTRLKGRDAPQEISLSKYTRRLPSDHYPVFVRLTLWPHTGTSIW